MGWLKKLKVSTIASRKKDEALYGLVADEMASGVRNEALWLKALSQANGDKEKQVSKYIQLRINSMKDDIEIINPAG